MKISYSIFFILLGFLSQSECILDGKPIDSAELKKYRYLVSIHSENSADNTAYKCTGGILNKRMILSAAHCFARWRRDRIDSHTSIRVTARTMTAEIPTSGTEASIVRFVDRIYVPKEFFKKVIKGKDVGGFADIAILRLSSDLKFDKLKTLTLPNKLPRGMLPEITKENMATTTETPTSKLPYFEKYAIVAGYGAHSSVPLGGGKYRYPSDNRLRAMDVKIGAKPSGDPDPNTNRRFVMAEPYGPQTAKGFCDGDSGAPLVMKKKIIGWTYYVVIGVAASNHKTCDDTVRPGQYTRVTTYLDFIKTVLKNPNMAENEKIVIEEITVTVGDTC